MKYLYPLASAALALAIVVGVVTQWERPDSGSDAGPDGGAAEQAQLYTCPMHPEVLQLDPGRCPVCGMDLIPARPAEEPSELPDSESAAAGIQVSPRFTQNFAVRTAEVVRGHIAAGVRTVGYLDHDEAKVATVHVKYEGWIERAHVNTIGERVSAGDLLFEIYSPEIVAAQQEYVSALAYARALGAAPAASEAVARAEALQVAAQERLLAWGLTAEQVARLEAGGEPARTVEVFSPASGWLIDKADASLAGLRVTPGTAVLKIADHSTLWVKVEFHERFVQDLRAGLRAEITLDAFPRRRWAGEVLFFQPSMNTQTQTLTGFVSVPNPDGLLRPKMYATVNVRLPGVRNAIIAPAEAVLHSGERSVVILDAGDGLFTPREVETGIESDGQVQVLRGLAAGERVVTSSQFLFDSESNLRTAIEQLLESEPESTNPPSGHRH